MAAGLQWSAMSSLLSTRSTWQIGACSLQHAAQLFHASRNSASKAAVQLFKRSSTSQAAAANNNKPPPSVAFSVPLRTGRPRLVVLGSGWAAARLVRDISPKLYDFTMISPRNHMVFTPLLASTTVGTLALRSVALPIRDVQRGFALPQNDYYMARATAVYPHEKVVECESIAGGAFRVQYDKLVICTGSQGSTFGIANVDKYAHFLREVSDAERIRNTLIRNIGACGTPGLSLQERERRLHTVIVGGGPTGVEFAGELCDFIRDLNRIMPSRVHDMRVTLVEANELLGSFDESLREYAARKLMRQGVSLVKGVVKAIERDEIHLSDGTVIPYGLCVWSTGVGPTPFISSLPFAKTAKGRLAVDEYLRVLWHPEESMPSMTEQPATPPSTTPKVSMQADEDSLSAVRNKDPEPAPGVYALGDCCANVDRPLPALAQVAEQQGKYLAREFNKQQNSVENRAIEPFQYRHLGAMASLGGQSAILQFGDPARDKGLFSLTGFSSWVAWRSAYLTRLGSLQKRLYVALDWTSTMFFGRDISIW